MLLSPLPPLEITSPLGIPNAPVGHTGIPIGAIELATPGVSPTTFGASPLIGATCAGASPAPTSAITSSPMTGRICRDGSFYRRGNSDDRRVCSDGELQHDIVWQRAL